MYRVITGSFSLRRVALVLVEHVLIVLAVVLAAVLRLGVPEDASDYLDWVIRAMLVAGVLQIQGHAALVAIQGEERRVVRTLHAKPLAPHGPGQISRARRFDLDDVSTQVGQEHRAERACHHLGQVQDADPFQRLGHRCTMAEAETVMVGQSRRRGAGSPSGGRGGRSAPRPPNSLR